MKVKPIYKVLAIIVVALTTLFGGCKKEKEEDDVRLMYGCPVDDYRNTAMYGCQTGDYDDSTNINAL